MPGGDVSAVAGRPAGSLPTYTGLANGTPAAQTRLNHPGGVMANSSGLYIADTNNCRVGEIAATTGTQRGNISMTANDEYTIAGTTGTCATSAHNAPPARTTLRQPATIHC